MSEDDWYMNTSWNSDIEEKFLAKLNRARSQRSHYLSTQANRLKKTHPEVAIRLLNLGGPDFGLTTRAEIMVDAGNLTEAVRLYKLVLKYEERVPNVHTGMHLILPTLVAEKQITSEFEEAVGILEKFKDRLTFPVEHFQWHAAMALITRDAVHAEKALRFADVRKSGFRFHQGLGLVGEAHAETIAKLVEISAIKPH